jgi:hypothetical protein
MVSPARLRVFFICGGGVCSVVIEFFALLLFKLNVQVNINLVDIFS